MKMYRLALGALLAVLAPSHGWAQTPAKHWELMDRCGLFLKKDQLCYGEIYEMHQTEDGGFVVYIHSRDFSFYGKLDHAFWSDKGQLTLYFSDATAGAEELFWPIDDLVLIAPEDIRQQMRIGNMAGHEVPMWDYAADYVRRALLEGSFKDEKGRACSIKDDVFVVAGIEHSFEFSMNELMDGDIDVEGQYCGIAYVGFASGTQVFGVLQGPEAIAFYPAQENEYDAGWFLHEPEPRWVLTPVQD